MIDSTSAIMERNKQNIRILFLAVSFCFAVKLVSSQDTTKLYVDTSKFYLDTTWFFSKHSFIMTSMCVEYSFRHSPTHDDSLICKKYKILIASEPSEKNFEDYFSLACSLWELGRLTESEKMFQRIVDSNNPFYTESYYHSSDIPGDTTTNLYGYGSYTSNYKNYSCRYLTKIYLEKKQYDQALRFIKLADKKYVVVQNCGTGYHGYREHIDGLYSLCFYGLRMYDTIIAKYIGDYSEYYSGILVKAIKKKYSPKQINNYLIAAERSIVCVVDTFQSSSYSISDYGTKDEKSVESKYTSGAATIKLFGRKVIMQTPHLEDGEVVTRERFLKEFKESGFYQALTEDDEK